MAQDLLALVLPCHTSDLQGMATEAHAAPQPCSCNPRVAGRHITSWTSNWMAHYIIDVMLLHCLQDYTYTMDVTHRQSKHMAKTCTALITWHAEFQLLGRWGMLFPTTSPAPTTLVAVAMCPPLQVEVATLAVPIPRPKVGITGIPAPTMLPEAIATPMHVVVPTTRAAPITCQKRSPWHLAHLTLHNALRTPRPRATGSRDFRNIMLRWWCRRLVQMWRWQC